MGKTITSKISMSQLEAAIATANRHVQELEFWKDKLVEMGISHIELEAWDTMKGTRGAIKKLRGFGAYLADATEAEMAKKPVKKKQAKKKK